MRLSDPLQWVRNRGGQGRVQGPFHSTAIATQGGSLHSHGLHAPRMRRPRLYLEVLDQRPTGERVTQEGTGGMWEFDTLRETNEWELRCFAEMLPEPSYSRTVAFMRVASSAGPSTPYPQSSL